MAIVWNGLFCYWVVRVNVQYININTHKQCRNPVCCRRVWLLG